MEVRPFHEEVLTQKERWARVSIVSIIFLLFNPIQNLNFCSLLFSCCVAIMLRSACMICSILFDPVLFCSRANIQYSYRPIKSFNVCLIQCVKCMPMAQLEIFNRSIDNKRIVYNRWLFDNTEEYLQQALQHLAAYVTSFFGIEFYSSSSSSSRLGFLPLNEKQTAAEIYYHNSLDFQKAS